MCIGVTAVPAIRDLRNVKFFHALLFYGTMLFNQTDLLKYSTIHFIIVLFLIIS